MINKLATFQALLICFVRTRMNTPCDAHKECDAATVQKLACPLGLMHDRRIGADLRAEFAVHWHMLCYAFV
jgi:hypothetical protein